VLAIREMAGDLKRQDMSAVLTWNTTEEPRLTDDQRAITRLKVSLISFARRNGLALPACVHTIGNGK
jgi:hypothetical protein